jgi:hypothetical protein
MVRGERDEVSEALASLAARFDALEARSTSAEAAATQRVEVEKLSAAEFEESAALAHEQLGSRLCSTEARLKGMYVSCVFPPQPSASD